MMHQPVVYPPDEVDVEGRTSRGGRIRYIGTAHARPNGRYVCLADVEGSLCRVEVEITFAAFEGGPWV